MIDIKVENVIIKIEGRESWTKHVDLVSQHLNFLYNLRKYSI